MKGTDNVCVCVGGGTPNSYSGAAGFKTACGGGALR